MGAVAEREQELLSVPSAGCSLRAFLSLCISLSLSLSHTLSLSLYPGPPGNGKSSVVMALASHFSLPVAVVPLARLDANTTIGEGNDGRPEKPPVKNRLLLARSLFLVTLSMGVPCFVFFALQIAVSRSFALSLSISSASLSLAQCLFAAVFSSAPPCSVLVLEDIDAVFSHGILKRDLHRTAGPPRAAAANATSSSSSGGGASSAASSPAAPSAAPSSTFGGGGGAAVSLSELLNALDGVGAQAGRLVVMTTNALGQLDAALVCITH